MQNFITLTLFAICWTAFCLTSVEIYDRICYHVLDELIKNAKTDKDHEKVLQLLLGV